MARTVTTFKWDNLKKGTPVFWIFVFGIIEGSCAYFAGQETVKQYPLLILLLPWIQWLVGQFKMFISNEVVTGDEAHEKVSVEGGEDGKLIVKKDDKIIDG